MTEVHSHFLSVSRLIIPKPGFVYCRFSLCFRRTSSYEGFGRASLKYYLCLPVSIAGSLACSQHLHGAGISALTHAPSPLYTIRFNEHSG